MKKWAASTHRSQCPCMLRYGMRRIGQLLVGNTRSIISMHHLCPNLRTWLSRAALLIPSRNFLHLIAMRVILLGSRMPIMPRSRGGNVRQCGDFANVTCIILIVMMH